MRIICGTILAAAMMSVAAAKGEDLARWVDPFIGTAGEGNCFPGPCRPFGMVQPSPDTGDKTHCGGYKFTDATIRQFSQTHLNGTGRPAMGDVGIMPIAGFSRKERKEVGEKSSSWRKEDNNSILQLQLKTPARGGVAVHMAGRRGAYAFR